MANALFDAFDPDLSGTIDYRELQAALKQTTPADDASAHGGGGAARSPAGRGFQVRQKRDRLCHGKGVGCATAKAATAKLFGGSKGSAAMLGGRVDSSEAMHMRLRRGMAQSWVRVVDLFRVWDVDGDGSISKQEFVEALCSLSLVARPKDADEFFDSFDVDGSGNLTLNELEFMLKQRPASPPSYVASPHQRELRRHRVLLSTFPCGYRVLLSTLLTWQAG